MNEAVDGFIVFMIGASVGIGELVARFRDEPKRAIFTRPAALYIGINGFASLFALVAIRTFGWTSGSATEQAARLLDLLLAGFGAMAVFRTSLFAVRVGTTDIGVGPVAFLQILLTATDRGVDRKRASERAERVVRIMGNLDPNLAFTALPAFAIMLMQNLTLEDQKAIGQQVSGLRQPSDIPDQAKVLNIGLLLMTFVGEEVLEDAVRGIRGQVKPSGVRLPSIGGRSRSGSEGNASPSDSDEPGPAADAASTEHGAATGPSAASEGSGGESTNLPAVDTGAGEPKGPSGSSEGKPAPGQSVPGTALPPQ